MSPVFLSFGLPTWVIRMGLPPRSTMWKSVPMVRSMRKGSLHGAVLHDIMIEPYEDDLALQVGILDQRKVGM